MSRSRTLAIVVALMMTACSGPNRLPLAVKRCDTLILPHAVTVQAEFANGADKPIRDARLQLDFYHDFTFTRVMAIADFRPQLEPQAQRSVALVLMNSGDIGGQAQRCGVVHIDYADGTSADAPQ